MSTTVQYLVCVCVCVCVCVSYSVSLCVIIMCAIIMCVHIRSLLPLPLLLPIHPLHPVTSSHTPHLSRRFVSWPLTPPPRSDSFRSTVHNVQTPCRPLRTRQGGRVRGLQCLSCHMHTIRRPPAPVGHSHLRTRVVRSFVHTLLI